MRIPKVLVTLSNAADGCSFYRGVGPWSAISRAGLAEVWYSTRPAWQDVRAMDALFMLRPCLEDLKAGAQAARDFGVPLMVDYDDDLLDLPSDNPSYALFSQASIQQNIREFLQGADAVVASTPFLAQKFGEFNKAVHVVRNAFDPCLRKWRQPVPQEDCVLWRGTGTHHRDVSSVAPEIVQAADKNPATLWAFIGSDPVPWECSELIKKVVKVPILPLLQYFKALYAFRPGVVIVPLADHGFNRSKSNIAAIEGAMVGAAVIAPDWEEWNLPGVLRYKNAGEFGLALRQLLTDRKLRDTAASILWEHVQKEMTLEAANAQRMRIVLDLLRERA